MKKGVLEPFRILLKIHLLLSLAYILYYKETEAKENSEFTKCKDMTLYERISKIEEENQQHKTEISLLKTVVEEDKKTIAVLTIKVDEEHEVVNQLKSHIERLEKSALKDFNTRESLENPTDSKTRNKRQAVNTATAKLMKNKCADSSRLCTFYYPDNPDVLSARNSNSTQNKNVVNSIYDSIGRKWISNQCSESSRLCTFAHPDHPDTLRAINPTNRASNQTFNSVAKFSEQNATFSNNANSTNKNEKNTSANFKGPPTNCSDLEKLGHTLNNYYLVKGTNKIEMVYCAFRQTQELPMMSKQVLQTRIGNVEVKTKSVYFHVRMTENLEAGWIHFKSRDINIGGAMSESRFTSPVAGTYHFQFYGIVHNPGSNFKISIGHHGSVWQNTAIKCQNCTTQFISMASTFRLEANFDIALYKPPGTSGILAGGGYYDAYSYFTGWLVEEDLVLS